VGGTLTFLFSLHEASTAIANATAEITTAMRTTRHRPSPDVPPMPALPAGAM
jgi:hypothetical protein